MFKHKVKSRVERLGSNYEAASLTFAPLDVERIKHKFSLEKEAIARGKENLPPNRATNFDDVEQRVVSFIDNEVHKSTEAYHDHMASFEQRINRLHAAGHVGTIENISMKAEGDFAALVRRDATSLHTAKDAVRDSEADLKNFKKKNDLNRSAQYPDSRFLYFSIALLLVTIETGVNGYFFAKGHEMGMLGGGFVALIPSFLNVLTGYYLGNYACRLAINKSVLKKYAGIFLCVALPIWCFGFNLLIAHYRTAMASMLDADMGNAARIAIETFVSAPFHLDDVESWLLLITGCTFKIAQTASLLSSDLYQASLTFNNYTRGLQQSVDEVFHRAKDISEKTISALDDVGNKIGQIEAPDSLINRKIDGIFSDLENATKRLNGLADGQSKSVESLISSSSILIENINSLNSQVSGMQSSSAVIGAGADNIQKIGALISKLESDLSGLSNSFKELHSKNAETVAGIARHAQELEGQLSRSRQYTEETHESLASMTKILAEKLQ